MEAKVIKSKKLFVFFCISCLALLFIGVSRGYATSLDKVMQGKVSGLEVEVRGIGKYYGDSIKVTFLNKTEVVKTVTVPLGLLLVPRDPSVQTMVCAGEEELEADPGTTIHYIKSFCGEKQDLAPRTGDIFDPGGIAPPELLKRIREIYRGGKFNKSDQDRVWQITQNLDISEGSGGEGISAEDATIIGVSSTILILIWMLLNNLLKVPIDPGRLVLSQTGREPAPEPHDDRPSWSLIHRKNYDDLFDEENNRWVRRNSAEGKAIIQKHHKLMSEKGFDYDHDADAFVEETMAYDKHTDAFRRKIDKIEELEIDAEEGDAAQLDVGEGLRHRYRQISDVLIFNWFNKSDAERQSQYDAVYERLEERVKYLDVLEKDAKAEHRMCSEQEKKAREEGDLWLEEQWRQRRVEALENVNKVQGEKLELTKRVDEKDRQYKTWADRQKKSWTGKEVGRELLGTFVPDPERQFKPVLQAQQELARKLSKDAQDKLFSQHDGSVERIKDLTQKLKDAEAKGLKRTVRQLKSELDAEKMNLDKLTGEIQMFHKKKAMWEGGAIVNSTILMTQAVQVYTQTRTLIEIGKAGVQFMKPELGVRRPSMIDDDGNIIGSPKKPKPGEYIADGSAASPEDISRRQNYDFYGVGKDGKIREIKGTGNVDVEPRKGELVVIRDKHSGKVSVHKYYGEGSDKLKMHHGVKKRLWKQAQDALGKKSADAADVPGDPGKPRVYTVDDGVSVKAPDVDEGAPSGGKEVKLPRDVRELKDMVDQEEMAKMVKDKPGPPQDASYRAGQKAEMLKRGETADYGDREFPTKKGWPKEFEDGQEWPTDARSFKKGEEWFPRDKDGAPLRSQRAQDLPEDFPREGKRWDLRDRELGIKKESWPENAGQEIGLVRNKAAEKIAARYPDFDNVDREIREAFRDAGIIADDVVNPEPGERFIELMEKRGITPEKYKAWEKALKEGHWESPKYDLPETGEIIPPGGRGPELDPRLKTGVGPLSPKPEPTMGSPVPDKPSISPGQESWGTGDAKHPIRTPGSDATSQPPSPASRSVPPSGTRPTPAPIPEKPEPAFKPPEDSPVSPGPDRVGPSSDSLRGSREFFGRDPDSFASRAESLKTEMEGAGSEIGGRESMAGSGEVLDRETFGKESFERRGFEREVFGSEVSRQEGFMRGFSGGEVPFQERSSSFAKMLENLISKERGG